MANDDVKNDRKNDPTSGEDDAAMALRSDAESTVSDDEVDFVGGAYVAFGTERYVNAAFFAGGVLFAFVVGRSLAGLWNTLAEWPVAVRAVPQLVSYAEDERPGLTMILGAVIGLILTISLYRKPQVRQWADEVATELYKVHWPERDVVTNGTIVVIVASLFATLYVGILDRIWGFITNLVYGA